jgi:putative CocE/NonD family hydrolase
MPSSRHRTTGKFTALIFALAVLALSAPARLCAQSALSAESWIHHALKIPTRDGINLYTLPLPIILIRTPFGAAANLAPGPIAAPYRELALDGYIFVFQDIRGRNGSTGEFTTIRALHDPKDPNGTDESTDAYDTIDWLVKNIPNNNGNVGVMGFSYPG